MLQVLDIVCCPPLLTYTDHTIMVDAKGHLSANSGIRISWTRVLRGQSPHCKTPRQETTAITPQWWEWEVHHNPHLVATQKRGLLTQKGQLPKNNSVPRVSTSWGISWFQLKRRKFASPAKWMWRKFQMHDLESRTWTGYNKGIWGDAELTDNSQLKGKLTRCFKDWCPDRRVICLVPLGEPSNPLGGRWKKGVWWVGGACLGQALRYDSDGGQSVSRSHHLTEPRAAAQVQRLD